ncbi:MAG TPA: RHS repeat-associated core domain-containing protein, partial [Bryobacteraceae bacterium]|nr:RHS repeat-associated core domain-containing protein [Bryobacteraceae bacterium]
STFGYLKTIVNGAGDTITFDSYTLLGDLASISTSPKTGVTNTRKLQYDAAQRVTKFIHPDSKAVTQEYTGRFLSKQIDEAGAATTFDYCASCGALETVRAPLAKTLKLTHNRDHDAISFTDANAKTTAYTYGQARELKQVDYPDGSSEAYTYDAFGRLSTTTNARRQTTTRAYDTSGRTRRISFSNGQTAIAYTYYLDDTLRTVADETGITTYTYTRNRQLETVTYDYTASGLSTKQLLTYTYNPDASLKALTWTNGGVSVASWTFERDKAGRVFAVTNSFGERTTLTYDREGKLVNQKNANNTELAYSYNEARGWPTNLTWKAGTASIASYALTYDLGANTVGNLTKVIEGTGRQVTYGYDALYRLTSEAATGVSNVTFGYDLAGNILTRSGALFATYAEANKIKTISGGTATYDADGNLTAASPLGATQFTWDARNKLRSAGSVSYLYNAAGLRIVRTSGTQKTFYIFSGTTLIGEVTNGTPTAAYTWSPSGLISDRLLPSGKSLFYHFGPQGETRQLTNAAAAVVATYSYDAYGRELATSGTDPNPFRYGGKYGYYSDSGRYLATARWYSPVLIRWLSRDPIGYSGGDNVFAYVKANPVSAVDPTGLAPGECNGLQADCYFDSRNPTPTPPTSGLKKPLPGEALPNRNEPLTENGPIKKVTDAADRLVKDAIAKYKEHQELIDLLEDLKDGMSGNVNFAEVAARIFQDIRGQCERAFDRVVHNRFCPKTKIGNDAVWGQCVASGGDLGTVFPQKQ